jgi:glutathione peroxidase
MRIIPAAILGLAILAGLPSQGKAPMSLFDFKVQSLDGKPLDLATLKGKVVLVVNVASECGFTPQYEGLQGLYEAYKDKGFTVVGFPCNQFGGQEPGTAEAIQTFCSTKFHVTFPMAEKVDVKGASQAPVYAFLTDGFGEPKWNFHKYLVGKDGKVVKAYSSKVEPMSEELKGAVEAALR